MKRRIVRKLFVGILLTLLAAGICFRLIFGRPGNGLAVISPARFSDQTLVIDAGHGGEDGGAVSSAGTVESGINLAIATRLDAVLGLYGVDTLMLRTTDVSLHDAGSVTLREKKSSDIRNRVAAIERAKNATLISIHQNIFQNRKYHGAQVFYANEDLSYVFAQHTQETLRIALDPENNRKAARIPTSVYLMNHITCRAILVECGFLSNPAEDALLQTDDYQLRIAAALAGAYLDFQQTISEGEPF